MGVAKDPLEPTVPNPTAAVNPSTASLVELAAVEFAGPVAMLNLLRFDGEAGRAAYGRYAQVAASSIASVGGALMYLGQAIDSGSWDSVAVVYYPSTQAYLAMQHDQQYIDAIPDRTAGLRARLLFPFALPSMSRDVAADLLRAHEAEMVEAHLVRWRTPDTSFESRADSSSTDAMRLKSVGGGLVTDGRWDELRLRTLVSCDGDPDSSLSLDSDAADSVVVFSEPVEPT